MILDYKSVRPEVIAEILACIQAGNQKPNDIAEKVSNKVFGDPRFLKGTDVVQIVAHHLSAQVAILKGMGIVPLQ